MSLTDIERDRSETVHDLCDPVVVRELFSMAGTEILFRVVQVARQVMKADKARDMDDALARHLARALMGENPQFRSVPGWSGMPCALSIAAVEPEMFARIKDAEEHADLSNPRFVMVAATSAFTRKVCELISTEVQKPTATQQSVQAAIDDLAGRFALAALPAKA